MRTWMIATAVVLSGCASHSLSDYTRTDGAPVNAAQEQATLEQCKGESAMAVGNQSDPGGIAAPLYRAQRETTITDGCMARNGYIQARQ